MIRPTPGADRARRDAMAQAGPEPGPRGAPGFQPREIPDFDSGALDWFCDEPHPFNQGDLHVGHS